MAHEASLFDMPPPRPAVNIAAYGSLDSILATESDTTLRFAHGDLIVSPEQFFELVKYRKGSNSR